MPRDRVEIIWLFCKLNFWQTESLMNVALTGLFERILCIPPTNLNVYKMPTIVLKEVLCSCVAKWSPNCPRKPSSSLSWPLKAFFSSINNAIIFETEELFTIFCRIARKMASSSDSSSSISMHVQYSKLQMAFLTQIRQYLSLSTTSDDYRFFLTTEQRYYTFHRPNWAIKISRKRKSRINNLKGHFSVDF